MHDEKSCGHPSLVNDGPSVYNGVYCYGIYKILQSLIHKIILDQHFNDDDKLKKYVTTW